MIFLNNISLYDMHFNFKDIPFDIEKYDFSALIKPFFDFE